MNIILKSKTFGERRLSGDMLEQWEMLTGRPFHLRFHVHSYILAVCLVGYVGMEVFIFCFAGRIADELGVTSSLLRLIVFVSLGAVPFMYKAAFRQARGMSYAVSRTGIALLKEGSVDKKSNLRWDQVTAAGSIGSKFVIESDSAGTLRKVKIPLLLECQELLFAVLVCIFSKQLPAPEIVRARKLMPVIILLVAIGCVGFGVGWFFIIPSGIGAWIGFGFFASIGVLIFYFSFYKMPFRLQAFADEIHLNSIGNMRRIRYEEIARVSAEITSSNKSPWTQVALFLADGRKVPLSSLDSIQVLLLLLKRLPENSAAFEFVDSTEDFLS